MMRSLIVRMATVFVIEAEDTAREGKEFAKGTEDGRMNLAQRWYAEGCYDEQHSSYHQGKSQPELNGFASHNS